VVACETLRNTRDGAMSAAKLHSNEFSCKALSAKLASRRSMKSPEAEYCQEAKPEYVIVKPDNSNTNY